MPHPLIGLRSALFRTAAAEPVSYTPPGPGATPVSLMAVRALDYQRRGFDQAQTEGRVTFEIQKADQPVKPQKLGQITDAASVVFRIIQIDDVEDVGSWLCAVERMAS